MKKNAFAILILLLSFFTTGVQANLKQICLKASDLQQEKAPNNDRTELTYYSSWEGEEHYTNDGNASIMTYAAIEIPETTAKQYQGKPLDCISIQIYETGMRPSKVFLTYDLKEKPFVEIPVRFIPHSENIIRLIEPYLLEGKRFYIGYAQSGKHPIALSTAGGANPLGDWVGTEVAGKISWQHLDKIGYHANNCIKGIINCASDLFFHELKDVDVNTEKKITLQSQVTNLSRDTITSVEVKYAFNGQTKSQTFEQKFAPNATVMFYLNLEPLSDTGEYPVNIEVTKVNGRPGTMENKSLQCTVYCRMRSLTQNMVVEEFTGTWCGWCPRGIVAMEQMKEKYPDRFIGIGVHDRDDFSTGSYTTVLNSFVDGFPSCVINRNLKLTRKPSFSSFENALRSMNSPALGAIKITGARYTNEAKTTLHVTTETRFSKDLDNNVRIAFVLIENGVVTLQRNNYAGGTEGNMGGFENLGNPARIKMNDIARMLYGDKRGIANSLPEFLNGRDIYSFEYDLLIPATVEDKSNLEVVALLIDQESGLIINGFKRSLNPNINTGITVPAGEVNEVYAFAEGGIIYSSIPTAEIIVYNLEGMPCTNSDLQPGVYIVRIVTPQQIYTRKLKF